MYFAGSDGIDDTKEGTKGRRAFPDPMAAYSGLDGADLLFLRAER